MPKRKEIQKQGLMCSDEQWRNSRQHRLRYMENQFQTLSLCVDFVAAYMNRNTRKNLESLCILRI